MAYAAAIILIKAILDNVVGVNNTFAGHPRKRTEAEMQSAFVDSGVFQVWIIRRITVDAVEEHTDAEVWETHIYQIAGFYQVDDSAGSEATLQALLDLVRLEFNKKDNLTLDGSHDQPFGARMTEFVEVQDPLGFPVKCHRGTIEVTVNEVVNP